MAQKLDSIASGRSLGKEPSKPSSGGPWSRAVKGDTTSSTSPPKEQIIKLSPQERPQRSNGNEQRKYNAWRRRRMREGMPVN